MTLRRQVHPCLYFFHIGLPGWAIEKGLIMLSVMELKRGANFRLYERATTQY
jgi:hypothetical protein